MKVALEMFMVEIRCPLRWSLLRIGKSAVSRHGSLTEQRWILQLRRADSRLTHQIGHRN